MMLDDDEEEDDDGDVAVAVAVGVISVRSVDVDFDVNIDVLVVVIVVVVVVVVISLMLYASHLVQLTLSCFARFEYTAAIAHCSHAVILECCIHFRFWMSLLQQHHYHRLSISG